MRRRWRCPARARGAGPDRAAYRGAVRSCVHPVGGDEELAAEQVQESVKRKDNLYILEDTLRKSK